MTEGSSLEVCIGIPTLNGPDRLTRCLESIRRHTPMAPMKAKVFVSDDYSSPEHLEANKRICACYQVDLLMTDERQGVAKQWNRLSRHTEAPVMILMNDDVEVVDDWLEALVFSIKSNPHAGMIGIKAYQGINSLNFVPPPVPSYNEAIMERGHGMLATTGFLFGFSRNKYLEVNGFDHAFWAFYEEVDFGIRLLERGWPSYMLSYPVVLHQGGATTSDPGNIDARRVLDESRVKFKAKHTSIQHQRDHMRKQEWPKPIQWNTMLSTWKD